MATKTETVSVIEQARISSSNLAALGIGMVLGGVVSLAAFVIIHIEGVDLNTWKGWVKLVMVAGALAFSAKSVYQWTSKAFNDSWKAAGWTVLVEGVMLITDTHWLSYLMLGLLVVINAMAAGCNLALQDMAVKEARLAKEEKLSKEREKRAAAKVTKALTKVAAANDNARRNKVA